MNLFWKKLFGGLMPTAKYEKQQDDLRRDLERYLGIEKSTELEEYNTLFHTIKSAKFKERKKIFQNRKYKDTEEYRVSKKYDKLKISADIRHYYETLNSSELHSYLAFKSTPEFEQLGNPEKVKASEKLRNYKNFEKSAAYKNYVRFHDSYIIKEYEQLKEKVSTAEFMKLNKFWSNKHRWETTEEYTQEQRYYALAKNPDIVYYTKMNPNAFKKIRTQKLAFGEEFNWNTLSKSRWTFGYHYKSDTLKKDHSFANEKQANSSGKNISVNQGVLRISTKEEKTIASAWDAAKGFIDKEFRFSSDVMQSANEFRQKYGVFQAKIRCSGPIHHAFWLGADNKLPHINIFHFDGKLLRLGNAGKDIVDEAIIKGLNPSDFHIYTMEWTEKELIFRINNLEIYRTTSNVPREEMYLGFKSFITEKQNGSEGLLEVDWVRVYKNSEK